MKLLHLIREKTANNTEYYIKAELSKFSGRLKYTKYFKFISDDNYIETYNIINDDSKLSIDSMINSKLSLDSTTINMKFSTFQSNYNFIIKNKQYTEISKKEYNKFKPKNAN